MRGERREERGERREERGERREQLLSVSLALKWVRARVVACVIVYREEGREGRRHRREKNFSLRFKAFVRI